MRSSGPRTTANDAYVVTATDTLLRVISSGPRRLDSESNGLVEGGGTCANDELRGVVVSSMSTSLPYGDWPYENGDVQAKVDLFSGCGVATKTVSGVVGPGSGSGSCELLCREWLSSITDNTLRSFEDSDLRERCPGEDKGGAECLRDCTVESGETDRGGVLVGDGMSAAHSVASEV